VLEWNDEQASRASGSRDGVGGGLPWRGFGRRAFSEREGIAVSTLDYYLRRENERLRKKQRLLPVVVMVKPEESKVAEIAVVLGNGRRVELRRGFEPELLLRVLSVLEWA